MSSSVEYLLASALLVGAVPFGSPAEVALPAPLEAVQTTGPEISWSAPKICYEQQPFVVEVEINAPKAGCSLSAWLLTPSAFTIDGNPLKPREDSTSVKLPPGSKLTLEFDLEPFLTEAEGFEGEQFVLGYAKEVLEEEGIAVAYWPRADKGLLFMDMTPEELSSYDVLLVTNRGKIHLELWPDVAPNHVRNFLDLAYTKFYDGAVFHRVIPGFMIQGGDPDKNGLGKGPRTLDLEPSDKLHVPGVLSMARLGNDKNSASCQFFIMHGTAPQLDGDYSAFGKLVRGSEVVDAIATTRRSDTRPVDDQIIERAIVLQKSASKKDTKEE